MTICNITQYAKNHDITLKKQYTTITSKKIVILFNNLIISDMS